MNKAFEKILERLEEELKLADEVKEKCARENPLMFDNAKGYSTGIANAKYIVQKVAAEYNGGWIPVKTRPMTEEEKEYYSEYLSEGNGMIYDCLLPDDGQEVLITSKYGSVDKTTFYTDCGNYFEQYEDYDEVIAWQPLPKAYKERD